ncbi:ornithine aminomutase subunit alpha [Thermobrachium celere]|uniref:D-Ornithine 4,5-aminomutase S subunit n=1 Tax=Thermobrachium celere DSM 8682 TaxID=941824 RepID=R7RSS6_9CLOT|nr:ornithine aminomutase subunit alpha [Thermobrachium celere]GFR35792.1 ornithine aminomutase [Thermobrachium celere]CDF58310.1 D-Ornithine 4,5-aminomutase S subunit [Thermobrachium celere DSM 8682]
MAVKRPDDFEIRRQHLKDLSDEELEKRFWQLAEEIVKPLVELAYTHTSPAVERSVLLRMGFSSIEAKAIVEGVQNLGLLGKGAGNVVYRLAKKKNIPIREAGLLLVEGKAWDEVPGLF